MISINTQKDIWKEEPVSFDDALGTFYLLLYVVGHMVEDHSENEKGNPLLSPSSSERLFMCTISQTGYHTPR